MHLARAGRAVTRPLAPETLRRAARPAAAPAAVPWRLRPAPGGMPMRNRLPGAVLGMRLLALGVVAGSGALLPTTHSHHLLLAGVLAGGGLGALQHLAARRDRPAWALALVPAHVAVWAYLLHVSGRGSPLFMGFIMEIVLSGTLLSRRGAVLATATSLAACLIEMRLAPGPANAAHAASVLGFIGASGILTFLLLEVLDRQHRMLGAYQAVLRDRADSLAEELHLLEDVLGDALLAIDPLGRVVGLNGAGERLLGVRGDEALGHAWQEVLAPDADGAARLARTLDTGEAQHGVRMLLQRCGRVPVVVDADLWTQSTPDGRRTSVLLAPPAPERDTPDDPLRRLGEAATYVAHQIKNSLHALQTLALAARSDLPAGQGTCLEQFRAALRSLQDLSDHVLAAARGARPGLEVVSIQDAVAAALALAYPAPDGVRVDLPEAALPVRAPRGQLVHALFNLLDNARKASPAPGSVRVQACRESGSVVLRVADGGPGFDPRQPPAAPGHGLGLVAVRRYLEACGGRLDISTARPAGTLCTVTLPCADASPAVPIEPDTAAPGR
jgi:signal transduction histidine kinase